jgi:hypothetical protein
MRRLDHHEFIVNPVDQLCNRRRHTPRTRSSGKRIEAHQNDCRRPIDGAFSQQAEVAIVRQNDSAPRPRTPEQIVIAVSAAPLSG